MLPLRETVEDLHSSSLYTSSQETERKDKDSGYEDFQEYDEEAALDSDMEGSVDSMLHRGRPKLVKRAVTAPAIPARNEKRASRILDNVMMELKALDGNTTKEPDTISTIQESDPHESYLSSEEDASLSDDYDDTYSLHDSAGTSSPYLEEASQEDFSRRSRRKSQEDTARVVSFIMVGKPQIVDITIHSNHTSPASSSPPKRHSLDVLTAFSQAPVKIIRRPSPLKLYPSTIRRMSISSITSTTSSSNTFSNTSEPISHPPQQSSRLATLTTLVTNTKNTILQISQSAGTPTHSFLTSDPFSATSEPATETPTTPKTPTSIAAQAWKRTLNKARRPSMPKLSLAYSNSSSSTTNLSPCLSNSPDKRGSRRVSTAHSNLGFNKEGSLPRIISENNSRTSLYSQEVGEGKEEMKRAETMTSLTPYTPTFSSYIPPSKTEFKAPPIPIETSSKETGRRSFTLGMGRKKSVKAR